MKLQLFQILIIDATFLKIHLIYSPSIFPRSLKVTDEPPYRLFSNYPTDSGLSLQGLQDNALSGSGSVSHFEPQVALLCDAGPHGQEAYHPKHMNDEGEWVSDFYSKATCFKDKMDILNYCKKVRRMNEISRRNIFYKFLPFPLSLYS